MCNFVQPHHPIIQQPHHADTPKGLMFESNFRCQPEIPTLSTLATFLSLVGLGMGAAHAQTHSNTVSTAATLSEVVVSGSRQEQAADDLPLLYDVINASTLSNQQSRSLREALQDLPNASVKRSPARFSVGGTTASAGRDGNVGINIRGLGGNRVLLMTDGVRMPRSYAFRTTTFDREYLARTAQAHRNRARPGVCTVRL